MFIFIVLQLTITAWINYPVDYKREIDDGKINLLTYYSEVGKGLKDQDNDDYTLSLTRSAKDEDYCLDSIS